MNPTLTIIAGANGAGKSYFSDYFLHIGLISVQPVNIDALEDTVDRDRIPNDPMRYQQAIRKEIDKVFLGLCKDAIENKSDFAFESNLRKDQLSCVSLFEDAGYNLQLIYIWIDSIEISKERVMIRVNEGGHPVGIYSIKGNFEEGISNLDLSVSHCHWNKVLLIDNSRIAKSKGETLSLLLEMFSDTIIEVSDSFFSDERKKLLPKICQMILDKSSSSVPSLLLGSK